MRRFVCFCFNTETLFCFYPVLCFRLFVRLSLPHLLQLFVIFVLIICNTYINTFPTCNYYLSYITLYFVIFPYSFIFTIFTICYILYYYIMVYPFLFLFCPPDWFLLFYHYYYYIYLYIIAHFHFLFFFLHAAQNFIQKK